MKHNRTKEPDLVGETMRINRTVGIELSPCLESLEWRLEVYQVAVPLTPGIYMYSKGILSDG